MVVLIMANAMASLPWAKRLGPANHLIKTVPTSRSIRFSSTFGPNSVANFLNDFRRPDWFTRFGLPVSNGGHNQLSKSQVRLLMRRVEQRACPQGGRRGGELPEVQVFSRLDTGHKDFLGEQFVNCRLFGTHHEQVLIC